MVELMTLPNCVQCVATKRHLDRLGVEFDVIDMSTNPEALERAKSLGYSTAPVVIAPDGSHWSGFDPDRLAALAA